MYWLPSVILIAFITTLCSSCSAAQVQQTVLQASPREKHVAIIGGGAAGTSAAYWLNNAFPKDKNNGGIRVSTTIYESSDYLGGRSTVVPIKDDPTLGLIELGASIFIERNYNLMNATERFGLERKKLVADAKNNKGLGIWNGKSFLFEESGNDYWDMAKILWRYGYSAIKFKNHLASIIDRFTNGVYDNQEDAPIFHHVGEALSLYGLEDLVNETASEYLLNRHGFSQKFVHEIIQTASRANYGQDVDTLHAFGALVSMAASGAWSTKGGNLQIFQEFAKRSGATIRLETTVKEIQNMTVFDEAGNPEERYIVITDNGMDVYDAVLIAAPLHSVNINFPFPTLPLAYRKFHTVHVTMIAGVPDPSYFGRTEKTVPTMIVSTGAPLSEHFDASTPPFTTFAIHKYLENDESVVKMFSHQAMTDEQLDQLFHHRSWTYRKEWEAFPELSPVNKENDEWPSMVLDGFEDEKMENGILYINAFESCISTMETETVASKNAVRYLRERWCEDVYCVPFGDGWGSK